MRVKIGIDLLGADLDPKEMAQSIINWKESFNAEVSFVFFSKKNLLPFFEDSSRNFFDVCYVEHEITMDENPLFAIRRKKDSSIIQGMHYLKNGKIDAFISCGNTGAILSSAKMILKTIDDISRPALIAMIPTKKKLTAMLDVGGNITFNEKILVEYAKLGIAFQKSLGIKKPKVGILNIGSERKKGTFQHQIAYNQLSKDDANYEFLGNIEGKKVFEGIADVLVTDGFTGNIFLKTSEGIASFVLDKIYNNLTSSQLKDIENLLEDLKKRLYYAYYPGALLIGVKKIVIKCHGYSSIKAVLSAIEGSIEYVKKDIIESIKSYIG